MEFLSYEKLEFLLPDGYFTVKKLRKIKNVEWIFHLRHTYDDCNYIDVLISNKGDIVYIESHMDEFYMDMDFDEFIIDNLIISSRYKPINLTKQICCRLFCYFYETLSFDLVCHLVDNFSHL
jgi:hypothetical protein